MGRLLLASHNSPHVSDIDVYLLQHNQASTTPNTPPAYALSPISLPIYDVRECDGIEDLGRAHEGNAVRTARVIWPVAEQNRTDCPDGRLKNETRLVYNYGSCRIITLGAHAQRGWVCLSVTLHLTSRVFVRFTKGTTYLTGNEGQKFRTTFFDAALQS